MKTTTLSSQDQQLLSLLKSTLTETTASSPAHDREYLLHVSEAAGPELENYARILFSTLRDLKRSYDKSQTQPDHTLESTVQSALDTTGKIFPTKGIVACQGCEGAYSQLACDKLMPYANIVYMKNFEGVFQAVQSGLCEYGILPIENSLHGTVGEVYDLLQHYNCHIVRSFKMQINHVLMANPGVKLSDVKGIISHEQALGQCSNFLHDLKDVKTVVCKNTAEAAQYVKESGRQDIAALSSPSCARLYGLTTIEKQVQNSDHNTTRFICITKDLRIYPGANRISLILSLPHRPGALYGTISQFSALGLNLTKLESRPIPGKDFEFLFYFDLEASVYSPEVWKLLGSMSSAPETFILLGCYSEC